MVCQRCFLLGRSLVTVDFASRAALENGEDQRTCPGPKLGADDKELSSASQLPSFLLLPFACLVFHSFDILWMHFEAGLKTATITDHHAIAHGQAA